ncbi:hypothetical protein RCOM_0686310 [Ricinus communis]|uniref:GTP binding protein n=1 Tax=Ricinus communis TaxID=3988 RepID=B9SLG4_RICCO|nr:hypothetical protein RCOM_0686310 [Ricinus communis]
MGQEIDATSLENRPGIFMIGSSNVGKRTLLSRLLSVGFEDASDSSTELLACGWTINTKYYTADVSVWMTHLDNGFSTNSLAIYSSLTALVMVFDMNDLSSFAAIQDWVSRIDIHKFEILLCIEYSRSYASEVPAWEIKRSCNEWCSEHNVEYIEACASNADFDKCKAYSFCLQVYQLVAIHKELNIYLMLFLLICGLDDLNLEMAYSATLTYKEELSEEESDCDFEYEVLSADSAELWDDTHVEWVSANDTSAVSDLGASLEQNNYNGDDNHEVLEKSDEDLQPSTSKIELQDDKEVVTNIEDPSKSTEINEVTPFEFEDLDQLMSEIGNICDNLRCMPDFQSREMAAKLAM